MKQTQVPASGWRVVFDKEAHAKALADINALYPKRPDGSATPERRDILGWYGRWTADLVKDPFHVLGAPPFNTDHPNIARFPADETLPVSGIADVNIQAKAITVIAVHGREPRRRP